MTTQGLIPEKLAAIRSADYTQSPEVQEFITDMVEDRASFPTITAFLDDLEDRKALAEWGSKSEVYEVLPVPGEKRERIGERVRSLFSFCTP
ncbi:MAG: hypothetical protein KGI03_00805 [Patescibacteria group bacterium]|nr:hypothetical protein [Patescibacteria group bacterium]